MPMGQTPEIVDFARRTAGSGGTDRERLERLQAALFDRRAFAFEYEKMATFTAAVTTIEAGEEEEDGFDFAGAFLDADRLVIGTRSEELVVIARVDGTAIGRVRPGGDDPDVTLVWGIGPGRLLVQGRRTRLLAVR